MAIPANQFMVPDRLRYEEEMYYREKQRYLEQMMCQQTMPQQIMPSGILGQYEQKSVPSTPVEPKQIPLLLLL